MFVRCSNCQTQFSLDDRQIAADGVAVRCAVCRYVFRVDPPQRGEATGWRVRTVDGDLFEADDLTTMRVWAREGRLHPDDTISRTGKHWIRLGDMPEFSDAFAGFPDLPVVLGLPERSPFDASEFSAVGPPPSFAGDDVDDAVQPVSRDPSERLDMSGVFAAVSAEDDADDTVVHGRAPGASEDTVTVGPAVVSRTSLFEDSASMVLDDLIAPAPAPEPEPEPVQRRKPKHQTTKVRTVAAVEDADPEASGVVRVIDELEAVAALAEEDAVQGHGDGRKPVSSGSMLGAVTAHVQSEPVKPLTGPQSPLETEEPSAEPEPAAAPLATEASPLELEQAEAAGPPARRSSWPLFAGLGLLCGAAVVFGIPQVRERVLGSDAPTAEVPPAPPKTIAQVDAAVARGVQAELHSAAEAADRSAEEASSDAFRADAALAASQARAAESLSLRMQALHSDGDEVRFRADDAAEAAAQGFAGVDVQRATPQRVQRTRAWVRLAQGRPHADVLSQVPEADAELRALTTGMDLWRDPKAAVPEGVVASLSSLAEPSLLARMLLAIAYHRSGDSAGAAGVMEALRQQAPDDPAVVAVSASIAPKPAAVTDEPTSPEVTPDDAPEPPPEETIVIKDQPKAVSIDTLIERGCSKVEGGDVSGGLKLLLKAFDRRPNDIDVLVCLGTANRKKGTPSTALRYYERALGRSPKFMPALLGAARSATKLGKTDKALGYYKRVLAVAPGNVEAKSFVAKTSASDKKPTPPSQTPKNDPPAGGSAGGGGSPPKKPAPPSPDRKPEPPKPAP